MPCPIVPAPSTAMVSMVELAMLVLPGESKVAKISGARRSVADEQKTRTRRALDGLIRLRPAQRVILHAHAKRPHAKRVIRESDSAETRIKHTRERALRRATRKEMTQETLHKEVVIIG